MINILLLFIYKKIKGDNIFNYKLYNAIHAGVIVTSLLFLILLSLPFIIINKLKHLFSKCFLYDCIQAGLLIIFLVVIFISYLPSIIFDGFHYYYKKKN